MPPRGETLEGFLAAYRRKAYLAAVEVPSIAIRKEIPIASTATTGDPEQCICLDLVPESASPANVC